RHEPPIRSQRPRTIAVSLGPRARVDDDAPAGDAPLGEEPLRGDPVLGCPSPSTMSMSKQFVPRPSRVLQRQALLSARLLELARQLAGPCPASTAAPARAG